MPVIKYRSFEEAQEAMWCFWPTEEYYRKLADLFEFLWTMDHWLWTAFLFGALNVQPVTCDPRTL